MPDYQGGNRLLDALPSSERDALLRDARIEHLVRRQPLLAPGSLPGDVSFPISALVSIVVVFENGETNEVGVVGREGFVPVEHALGVQAVQRTAFCQVAGETVHVGVAAFRAAIEQRGELFGLVQRSIGARLFAAEQLVGCNITHSLRERCARWLLMTRDRVGENEFPLTHDFLAMMLGVRRASVTEIAGELQEEGAIKYQRGLVTITDEAKLAQRACECYAAITTEFERVLTEGRRNTNHGRS
ncbi:MAG TPA: Crp/Fnr family transcriptional regulator [Candidatus Elarobacter sp.]|nr:Crp/Fnr family transcriptional regulator [Candidatus Elarobacter sp.]